MAKKNRKKVHKRKNKHSTFDEKARFRTKDKISTQNDQLKTKKDASNFEKPKQNPLKNQAEVNSKNFEKARRNTPVNQQEDSIHISEPLISQSQNRKEVVLSVKNVSKTFEIREKRVDTLREYVYNLFRKDNKKKTIQALKDVNFEVIKGEKFGIIGHNGSGKSTLLRCLIGSLEPNKGYEIEHKGRIMKLALGAGFDPNITARENIYLNGSILGLSFKKIGNLVDSILSYAELEDFIDTPVKFYSAGMRSRLAFAIAIHSEAEIYLFDEFFGGVGDVGFQRKSNQAFTETFIDNKTVVMVSHNLNLIKAVCDRAIVLNKGEQIGPFKSEVAIEKYLQVFNETSEKPPEKKKINNRKHSADVINDGSSQNLIFSTDIGRSEYMKLRQSLSPSVATTQYGITDINGIKIGHFDINLETKTDLCISGFALTQELNIKSSAHSIILRLNEEKFYKVNCDLKTPYLSKRLGINIHEKIGFKINISVKDLKEKNNSIKFDIISSDLTSILNPLKKWNLKYKQ